MFVCQQQRFSENPQIKRHQNIKTKKKEGCVCGHYKRKELHYKFSTSKLLHTAKKPGPIQIIQTNQRSHGVEATCNKQSKKTR